ncbi:MAG: hypothetical protein A3I43_01405 [Omnitrophica WOR_2 bacterium RIFCSPLOWO2_02_FULL_50_19]|nr:MAG: hypothetical protein A3I43_01405 [Omnitrophica WOR_2 bacterium RIFCSPLOWO2_02_FULL_50_19]
MKILFAIGLTLLLCAGCIDSSAQGVDPKLLDEFLWWFPSDTETLVVAQGPFEITEPLGEADVPLDAQLRVWLTAELGRQQLFGRKILLAVEGSRHFRAPSGFGVMPYEGCNIILFEESLGGLFESLKEHATRVKNIQEHVVIIFEEKREHDIWTIFLVQLRPNLLLCATDKAYLKELLSRIDHGANQRALPPNLPEWEYVDTGQQFWAIRHYDKTRAKFDPSSPLAKGKNHIDVADNKAVGLVFSFDPRRSKMAKVKHLSENENADKIVAAWWTPSSETGPFRKVKPSVGLLKPGVVQVEVDVTDPETATDFFFVLFGALGHGIYL